MTDVAVNGLKRQLYVINLYDEFLCTEEMGKDRSSNIHAYYLFVRLNKGPKDKFELNLLEIETLSLISIIYSFLSFDTYERNRNLYI